uniref:Uncharacterized protein n=1 Tax=Arundo donax TaxID=35708 RepID=A0A0A9CHG9_ARUDO
MNLYHTIMISQNGSMMGILDFNLLVKGDHTEVINKANWTYLDSQTARTEQLLILVY